MDYNFDQIIERRKTNCVKWDLNSELFGVEDVLDMWVADMDFPCPAPVLEALRRRLDHPILGYGFPPASLYEVIRERLYRRYGWAVEKDWIVFTPGVVTALYSAVRTLAEPGDGILLQPPVYPPFFRAVVDGGCQVAGSPLRLEDGGYVMDFDDLRRRLEVTCSPDGKTGRIRALILCSPHNPVGRVWTTDELRQLSDICLAHDWVIVSDEIHCDLLPGEVRHTPTATLSPEVESMTITLMSPSKTFNLAGMEASFAIIPDADLRKRFLVARAGQSGVNVLGLVAMEAALRHGDDYLAQLNKYLSGNIGCFARGIAGIPPLRLVPPGGPEGSYLAWVDFRGLGLSAEKLRTFLLREARLATNAGPEFGLGGEGFHRFNLGCPRSLVEEAVSRLGRAVAGLSGG
jgi:cystathionine beta-lyase